MTNSSLIPISKLIPGDSFYFPDTDKTVFTVFGFQNRPNGEVKTCVSRMAGKLYPVYISVKHSVIKISPNAIN